MRNSFIYIKNNNVDVELTLASLHALHSFHNTAEDDISVCSADSPNSGAPATLSFFMSGHNQPLGKASLDML